jgi:orotate phosphoribosyltransferase
VLGQGEGGVIVAFETARQLRARVVWAQTIRGRLAPPSPRSIRQGASVLIVDDVLTTGKTILALDSLLNEFGAKLAGVAVIIDRGENPMDFGVPSYACYELRVPIYTPDACPLCQQGMPLARPPTMAR